MEIQEEIPQLLDQIIYGMQVLGLRSRIKIWENLSQDLNYNVMFSQRGVMNLAHNLQIRDLKRRTHANRLNGIDAVWLNTEEVKILSNNKYIARIRYPVRWDSSKKSWYC